MTSARTGPTLLAKLEKRWSSRHLNEPDLQAVTEDTTKCTRRATILATATAWPPHIYPQADFCEAYVRSLGRLLPEDEDFIRRVFKGTLIKQSETYLPRERLFEKLDRAEYLDYIRPCLLDLGKRAAENALADWGGDRSFITHVIFGTMTTGIVAPTIDALLVSKLGLKPTTKRINVENMGCITGFRCINQAVEIALSGPNKKILVVVADIRTGLQNQLEKHEDLSPINRAQAVTVALFRDGAGAVIVSSSDATEAALRPLYEVLEGSSYLVPNTQDLISMREGDDSTIRVHISKQVPLIVKAELPTILDSFIRTHNLNLSDCTVALHPGGPKVIREVADAIGVPHESLTASWQVLMEHGNLSGSTNIPVLDTVRHLNDQPDRNYVVCIGIGPGVSVELILLRVLKKELGCGPQICKNVADMPNTEDEFICLD